ncbi:uncharacterized protein LOC124449145 [Xenia sp. Carnegie-2017]|uniref:uncharacterized protein LOC124449145 n=1 Tax=Xenia sp. Carnegie-2017 TaxID=2897299 RepID=UPI001F045FE3|nr:uncharacterized protein LOC124449145 [Xenia sp. Carnegie-2017]
MTTKQYSGDVLEQLLRKCSLKRALRVSSWLFRFANNCTQGEKRTGPLSFTEIEEAKMKFVKKAKKQGQLQPKYEQQCKELNLTRNTEGILECRGRIVGQYPIYLPTDSLLAQRVVEKLHRETLHGGVGLTMAAVRETYWIPKLRSLVKKVRKECFGCKRYRATSVPTPPAGKLPEDRTCGETAFEVIGVDFAGPIRYKGKSSKDCKAYLALFLCSLTRAVYLDMMPDLSASTLIPILKRFIARRGRPRKIYSENGGTFIKTAKWIDTLRKEERLQGYLEEFDIKWQWGRGANLKWEELCEVILDVEVQINRRRCSTAGVNTRALFIPDIQSSARTEIMGRK